MFSIELLRIEEAYARQLLKENSNEFSDIEAVLDKYDISPYEISRLREDGGIYGDYKVAGLLANLGINRDRINEYLGLEKDGSIHYEQDSRGKWFPVKKNIIPIDPSKESGRRKTWVDIEKGGGIFTNGTKIGNKLQANAKTLDNGKGVNGLSNTTKAVLKARELSAERAASLLDSSDELTFRGLMTARGGLNKNQADDVIRDLRSVDGSSWHNKRGGSMDDYAMEQHEKRQKELSTNKSVNDLPYNDSVPPDTDDDE